MTKKIGIGGSDFGELIQRNLLFVDKTLFIKEIINDESKVTLITRPRRWGKTLNLSMLYYFLSAEVYGQKTKGLFDNLLIAKEPENYVEKHQGKYPVIFLSLKDLKKTDFSSALYGVELLIKQMYEQHIYLLSSAVLRSDQRQQIEKHITGSLKKDDLEISLRILSQLLYQHHQQKVYVLIDEYDTPLNFARTQEYFDDMTLFMKNFLGASLKDNPYLQKGIMTGILRISKDSMLSGLNNPEVYTVLKDKRYAPYFGFTDAELDELFVDQNLIKDEAQVKAWYNGYCINGLTLYNPWSIMSCLKNEAELGPYWLDTGSDDLLKELLQGATAEVKQQFQDLVLGNSITVPVNQTMRFDQVRIDKSMLWNLLISAGYLKVLSTQYSEEELIYECEIAIPNREVLALYRGIFLRWLTPNDSLEIKPLIRLLGQGKVEEFATAIERFLKMAASVHDYAHQPEAFYHGFMLALSTLLIDHYYVFSNHESGLGRPDLLLIPKDTQLSLATILEFKVVNDNSDLHTVANNALAQIETREYSSVIAQYDHITTVSHAALVFDGKTAYGLQDTHIL